MRRNYLSAVQPEQKRPDLEPSRSPARVRSSITKMEVARGTEQVCLKRPAGVVFVLSSPTLPCFVILSAPLPSFPSWVEHECIYFLSPVMRRTIFATRTCAMRFRDPRQRRAIMYFHASRKMKNDILKQMRYRKYEEVELPGIGARKIAVLCGGYPSL